MNNENTKYLIEKYPELYSMASASPKESCMCFGFECLDGWLNILDELSEKITKWNEGKSEENQIKAWQVKEKYGGLRFYTNWYNEEVEAFIREAEDKADNTCENCGASPAKARKGGWITTLCDECAKNEGRI